MNKHLLAVAALICGTGHASEWDLTYRPPLEQDQFTPQLQAQPTAAATWATGAGAGSYPLVRYNDDGHIRSVDFFSERTIRLGPNTPDGGVVGLSGWVFCSDMRRFDRNGRELWRRTATSDCGKVEVDGAGGVWTVDHSSSRLTRYKADGTSSIDLPLINAREGLTSDLVADPSGAAAYLAGTVAIAAIDGVGRAAIERVVPQGLDFWRWSDEDPQISRALEVTVTSDGDVFAIGDLSVGEDARLIGIRLDDAGHLIRLERSQDLVSVREEFGAPEGPRSLRAGSDGSTYALAHRIGEPLGSQELVRFDASGAIAWTRPLAPSKCLGCSSAATADGGVALYLTQPDIDPGFSPSIVRRFAADGTSTEQPGFGSINPAGYDFGRYLATGELIELETTLIGAPVRKLIDSAQDAAGDTYLLTRTRTGQRLEKLSGSGDVAWFVDIDDAKNSQNGSVRVSGGRACAISAWGGDIGNAFQPFVTCVDSTDGNNRAKQVQPRPTYARLDSLGTAGIADLLFVETDRVERVTYAGSGWSRKYQVQNFSAQCIAQDGIGRNLLVGLEGSSKWRVRFYDPDGTLHSEVAAPSDGCLAEPRLLPDGSALLVGTDDANRVVATLLGPDGGTRWTRVLTGLNWNWTAAYGDAIYLAQANLVQGDADGPVTGLLTRLSRASGATVWTAEFDDFGRATPRVFASANGLLYAVARDTGLGFRVLDPATGSELSRDVKSCGGGGCEVQRIELDVLQRLQVAAWRDLDAQQGSFAFLRADRPFELGMPHARVDQSALDGVWYAPESTGQGVVLDYIEAAQTSFISWFTYTQAGGLALSEQRWYTLQGSVAPNAGTVALDILENRGGRFAQPPATAAQAVGHATLRFPSCNTALLDYAFDPGVNGGARGTLGLQPLTPGSATCGALGETPVPQPSGSFAGLNQRWSGTWYDPASAGQGFSLVVRPSSIGSYVFAAWYAYDPAGAPDDPTAQHWFTMQLNANPTPGAVTMEINRTIGGKFDYVPTRDTYRVGTATLKFTSCGTATLDYQFETSELAAGFAGLAGQLNLVGIDTCP